jgi:hypothetical protein
MFSASQPIRFRSTAQSANGGKRPKTKRTGSVLQLLLAVTAALFIAGIAVPSFSRSATATNHAVAVGTLHTFAVAGITFTYTVENLGFALLGALFGTAVALLIESPSTLANATRIFRSLRPLNWKLSR